MVLFSEPTVNYKFYLIYTVVGFPSLYFWEEHRCVHIYFHIYKYVFEKKLLIIQSRNLKENEWNYVNMAVICQILIKLIETPSVW